MCARVRLPRLVLMSLESDYSPGAYVCTYIHTMWHRYMYLIYVFHWYSRDSEGVEDRGGARPKKDKMRKSQGVGQPLNWIKSRIWARAVHIHMCMHLCVYTSCVTLYIGGHVYVCACMCGFYVCVFARVRVPVCVCVSTRTFTFKSNRKRRCPNFGLWYLNGQRDSNQRRTGEPHQVWSV